MKEVYAGAHLDELQHGGRKPTETYDMAVRMCNVMAIPRSWYVCFSANQALVLLQSLDPGN